MKSIGIITNTNKDKGYFYTNKLIHELLQKPCKIFMEKNHFETNTLNLPTETMDRIIFLNNLQDVIRESEILITLGGDGSFLKTARKTFGQNKSLVGLNLGNLGFLTEIDGNNLSPYISKIFNDEYTIEKRMMIEVVVRRNDKIITQDLALNDAVISSQSVRKMIHLNTFIDDVFLEYMPGDGLIVATPTGSTAYSLSSGGPLMEPEIDMMIVTPICPHNLTSRPCVISGDRKVKITLDKNFKPEALLTVDGKNSIHITREDIITIKKSKYHVNILKLSSDNFFDVLRRKLNNRDEKKKHKRQEV
jgi:NAD+ kinase